MKNYELSDISQPPMRPAHDLILSGDLLAWQLATPANINGPFDTCTPEADTCTPEASLTGGRASLPHAWYRDTGKRVLDVLLVIATLPVSAVVILTCAIALWIKDGVPFYRQVRLGKGGRRFAILKLRTMVRDADAQLEHYLENDPAMREEWQTTQKLKNDPRITRFGAFLRATSLDELPQLWNVLTGDMSLVGPRPMMPEQLPLYGTPQAYFAVRPGITGLWQVSARNESRFDFRAGVDARYFRNMSLLNDLQLLLKTVTVVVRRTGY